MTKTHLHLETVYYADTDAYGIVWHGAYLRWLEKARYLYCQAVSLDLGSLEQQDILFPVIEINLRYKASAKLHDHLCIETDLTRFSKLKLLFKQTIYNQDRSKTLVVAQITVGSIHQNGIPYRILPPVVERLFTEQPLTQP